MTAKDAPYILILTPPDDFPAVALRMADYPDNEDLSMETEADAEAAGREDALSPPASPTVTIIDSGSDTALSDSAGDSSTDVEDPPSPNLKWKSDEYDLSSRDAIGIVACSLDQEILPKKCGITRMYTTTVIVGDGKRSDPSGTVIPDTGSNDTWLVGDNNLQFTDTGNTLPTLKDWAPDVQNYCRDSALIKNHGIVVRTGPLTDIGKNKSMSLLKYTDGSRVYVGLPEFNTPVELDTSKWDENGRWRERLKMRYQFEVACALTKILKTDGLGGILGLGRSQYQAHFVGECVPAFLNKLSGYLPRNREFESTSKGGIAMYWCLRPSPNSRALLVDVKDEDKQYLVSFLAFNTWPCAKTPPFCHPLRVLEASDHFGRNKWVLCLKKMEIKRWAPEKKGWDADSHRVIEIPPNPSGEGRHVEIHLDTGKSTSSLPLEMVQQMAEYFSAPGQNVNVEENVSKKRPPFTISSEFESPNHCFCFLTFAAIPSKGNPAAADVVVSTNIYNFVYRFRYGSSDTKDLEGLVWPTPLKDTSDYNKSLSGKFGLNWFQTAMVHMYNPLDSALQKPYVRIAGQYMGVHGETGYEAYQLPESSIADLP